MNATIEIEKVRELLARIANSDSPSEALALFLLAAPLLRNCKIVLAAKRGGLPGFAVNRTFSGGAAVRSLFKTEKVLVLDVETVREMSNGKVTYPIDYSISLDTQALSYLEPYIDNRRARLPEDFSEVFKFIARDDVFIDPLPYRLENLPNLDDPKAADRIFKKLRAYEVLRNLDSQWLQNHGEVRATLSELELTKLAQGQIAQMFRDRADKSLMGSLRFRYQWMYCQLLKMVLIHLQAPSGSVDQKTMEFAEFLDKEFASMNAREIVLARSYFVYGQKLTFFGKMQKMRISVIVTGCFGLS
jgi:hypothetical protein